MSISDVVFAAVAYVKQSPEWSLVRDKNAERKLDYVQNLFDRDKRRLLEVNLPAEKKCEKMAINLLEKAKASEETQLQSLNKALQFAVSNETLFQIYSQRASYFASRNLQSEAKDDFNEAIEFTANNEVLFKMHHKLAQSCSKLQLYEEAARSLKASEKYLCKVETIDQKVKESHQQMLSSSIKKMERKKIKAGGNERLEDERNNANVFKVNVRIESTVDRGRYLVADEDIPAGAVIAVETPVCAILNPDEEDVSDDFCSHCLKKNVRNPFPCNDCSAAIFCSKGCKKAALNSYHKFECKLNLNALRKSEPASSYRILLALKMFLKGNYDKVLKMTSHENDREEENSIKYAVIACILLRLLKLSGYFVGETGESSILHILHSLVQIQDVNTHEVLALDESDAMQVGLIGIGNAINVNIGSVINHSCSPNTCRVNKDGGDLILIASEKISEGEEITDNYAMHYFGIRKTERRIWLKDNFFFECQCRACKEDLPTEENMAEAVPEEALQKLRHVEKAIHSALRKEDFDVAIELHFKDLEIINEHCETPHKLFVSIRQSLKFCLWRKYSR